MSETRSAGLPRQESAITVLGGPTAVIDLGGLRIVSDPTFDGLTVTELISLAQRGPYRTFLFVVDHVTLTDPEHPILVLDLADEPGRTFRVVPSEMWGIENNLSIANMDFAEFAESTDADGVFRGFPNV